jgi:hypothetical protein
LFEPESQLPARRFPIAISPWLRPFLYLFGATRERAWLDVDRDSVEVQFSWYRISIPRSSIVVAEPGRWPFWGGIGWRTNLRDVIGLIGGLGPAVRIEIDPPIPTRLVGIPVRLRELYVTVENPDGLPALLAAGSRADPVAA